MRARIILAGALLTAVLLVLAGPLAGTAVPKGDPLFGESAIAAPVLLFAPGLHP